MKIAITNKEKETSHHTYTPHTPPEPTPPHIPHIHTPLPQFMQKQQNSIIYTWIYLHWIKDILFIMV